MLKDAIGKYLDDYVEMWKNNRDGYPQISADEDELSELCFGQVDEDGYIQWKYKENQNIVDYLYIEERYSIKIPDQLKVFFSSFLFLDLQGFYQNELLYFNPIDENYNVLNSLSYDLENTDRKYVYIGQSLKEDLPLAVELETGYVVIHDWEKNGARFLASSLEEIFKNLLTKRNV